MVVDVNSLIPAISNTCHRIALALAGALLVFSPWCFGSWEKWWFWPMVALLCAAALFAGLGTFLRYAFLRRVSSRAAGVRYEKTALALLAAFAPFLLYALWRAHQPSAPDRPLVWMEAERSLLLFATPVLLGLTLLVSASRRAIRALCAIFLANAVLISLYAIANHYVWDGKLVLWSEAFAYYPRVSAVMFCPNHLAAYLNLAVGLAVAGILSPRATLPQRACLALTLPPMLLAHYFTVSRGGMLALFAVLPVALTLGLRGWSLRTRIAVFAAAVLVGGGAIALLLTTDNTFNRRLRTQAWPIVEEAIENGTSLRTLWDSIRIKVDRGQYIDSALRAWRSNPVVGIGPGQHSIRWPEFAATEDGDRATGKRPTLNAANYYLYEVHSDWTQLLEEYGAVGLALFLIAFAAVVAALLRAQGGVLRHRTETLDGDDGRETPAPLAKLDAAIPVAALFAITELTVHSVAEFALQIPAITWTLAFLVTAGLAVPLPKRSHEHHEE